MAGMELNASRQKIQTIQTNYKPNKLEMNECIPIFSAWFNRFGTTQMLGIFPTLCYQCSAGWWSHCVIGSLPCWSIRRSKRMWLEGVMVCGEGFCFEHQNTTKTFGRNRRHKMKNTTTQTRFPDWESKISNRQWSLWSMKGAWTANGSSVKPTVEPERSHATCRRTLICLCACVVQFRNSEWIFGH